jgi:hypothetical protein
MANMKIETPNCPKCNSQARGTVETIPACAEFDRDVNDAPTHSGYTEVFWEEQKTNRDKNGRVELICYNHHSWFSRIAKN